MYAHLFMPKQYDFLGVTQPWMMITTAIIVMMMTATSMMIIAYIYNTIKFRILFFRLRKCCVFSLSKIQGKTEHNIIVNKKKQCLCILSLNLCWKSIIICGFYRPANQFFLDVWMIKTCICPEKRKKERAAQIPTTTILLKRVFTVFLFVIISICIWTCMYLCLYLADVTVY